MAHIIHCCMLLFIVFILAEIGRVLVSGDPRQTTPITIWEDSQQPPQTGNNHTISYRQ